MCALALSSSICTGYSIAEFRDAKYKAAEVRDAGFRLQVIRAPGEYTAKEVTDAKYTINELVEAGYTAGEVRSSGYYGIPRMKQAGFKAKEMHNSARFSVAELKSGGYLILEVKEGGLKKKEIISTYDLQTVKGGGYTAKECYDVIKSAARLRDVGFSVDECWQKGWFGDNRGDMYTAFPHDQVKCLIHELVGPVPSRDPTDDMTKEVTKMGTRPKRRPDGSWTTETYPYQATVPDEERIRDFHQMPLRQCRHTFGMNATACRKYRKPSPGPSQLKHEGGFNFHEIREAGFSVAELKSAFNLREFKDNGMTVGCLERNFSIDDLKRVGYTLIQIKGGGFSVGECKSHGGYRQAFPSSSAQTNLTLFALPPPRSARKISAKTSTARTRSRCTASFPSAR